MAKKRSQAKKHKFKYAQPTTMGHVSEVVETPQAGAPVSTQAKAVKAASVAVSANYGYVVHDVGRIGMLAVSLVSLEVLLWYLFGHTGLGSAVYSLINV